MTNGNVQLILYHYQHSGEKNLILKTAMQVGKMAYEKGQFNTAIECYEQACQYGIRVNVIAPGAESPSALSAFPELLKWSEESGVKANFTPSAIPRMGRPEEDIGRVVAFLCSEEASFLTGYTYCIDGGACIDASR